MPDIGWGEVMKRAAKAMAVAALVALTGSGCGSDTGNARHSGAIGVRRENLFLVTPDGGVELTQAVRRPLDPRAQAGWSV
jgi:hypothetical protein